MDRLHAARWANWPFYADLVRNRRFVSVLRTRVAAMGQQAFRDCVPKFDFKRKAMCQVFPLWQQGRKRIQERKPDRVAGEYRQKDRRYLFRGCHDFVTPHYPCDRPFGGKPPVAAHAALFSEVSEKRLRNRRERWSAYQARRAGFTLCRRFRRPSGITQSPVRFPFLLTHQPRSTRPCAVEDLMLQRSENSLENGSIEPNSPLLHLV